MSVTDRDRGHLSIGEVLALLQGEFPDVTISKIRFLESQGLIDPERTPSGYRKFYDADIGRLRSILTLQRDHFLPLRVIKERIETNPELLDLPTGAPVDAVEDRDGHGAGDGATGTRDETPRPLVLSRPDRSGPKAGDTTAADDGRGNGPAEDGADADGSGRVFPWMQRAGTRAADGPAAPGDGAPPTAEADASSIDETATDGSGAAADLPAVVATAGVVPRSTRADRPEQGAAGVVTPLRVAGSRAPDPAAPVASSSVGPAAEGDAEPSDAAGPAGAIEPDLARAEPTAASSDRPDPEQSGRSGGASRVHAITGDVSSVQMTTDELAAATGLSAEQLAELERFGLIAGTQTGPVRFFDDDALVVARLAARLGTYGIEPRHLRMYKVAAEREVALYDQVVSPLAHHRDRGERAAEVMAQLVDLGEAMRRALVQRASREPRRS